MTKRLIALVTVVAGTLLVAAPASAAGAGQVAGDQTPVATCDGDSSDLGTFSMDGSLIGCWFADSFEVVREHASGTVQITGTEHFDGCLDLGGDGSCSGDPEGTLSFSFQFSGKFDRRDQRRDPRALPAPDRLGYRWVRRGVRGHHVQGRRHDRDRPVPGERQAVTERKAYSRGSERWHAEKEG